jgi:hypothetical protein
MCLEKFVEIVFKAIEIVKKKVPKLEIVIEEDWKYFRASKNVLGIIEVLNCLKYYFEENNICSPQKDIHMAKKEQPKWG